MSDIYIAIANKEIEFLKKERYLNFVEHGCIQGFFVYVRFDRHFDMIKSVDDLNYVLSDTGKVLLKRILETSSSYIFWSMVRLENYVGEEDAYLNCLNLIKKQEF